MAKSVEALLEDIRLLGETQFDIVQAVREGSDFFVNLDCATTQTIERAQFLQSRVRECKSAGCLNSKL